MFNPRRLVSIAPPPEESKKPGYSGVGAFASFFETTPAPAKQPFEEPSERKARVRKEKEAAHKEKLELLVSNWNPHGNPKATRYI